MGGTLLNKRYIKRKQSEEDREEGEVVDVETTDSSTGPGTKSPDHAVVAPRKRQKRESPKADTTTTTATHTNAKQHRVSFNALAPSVVSIDGLGSQIIQRFRDSIWYTVSVFVAGCCCS
jgi:hypothetical protein